MSACLKVDTASNGDHVVTDAIGNLVDGPFPTNAEAWAALERLSGEHRIPAKAKPRKPARKLLKGKAAKKLSAKQTRQMKRDAAKAPGWLRTGAAAKFDPNGNRQYRDHKLGTLGPASECRKVPIDEYLKAKGGAA